MIVVNNLTKIYKVPKKNYKKNLRNIFLTPSEEKYGVKNISFNINEGEIVGFVGLNGAGKTTTIKMLSGILTPTSGEIIAFGKEPSKNRKNYTNKISVLMGQKSILFYDIPVIESFKFYKDVYSLTNDEFNNRLELLTKKLNLESLLHIPVRKLSLGQRMKCEIVASILHNPKIIFLDEPTLGLDIISKQNILEFFKYLNQTFNTTIFLTTHNIDDIDKLCERIIIIDKGELKYDGKTEKIYERDKFKMVEIIHDKDFDIKSFDDNKFELVYQKEYVTCIKTHKQDLSKIIECILGNKNILDFNINTISLEEILHNIYDGAKEGKIYV